MGSKHGNTSTNIGREVEVDNLKDYMHSRSLAKVIRKQKGGYVVEYLSWFDERGKSLREFKKEAQVGHVCQESELDVQSVQIGDCLEWWKDDCWWKACVVSNQSKNGKLDVRIRVHNS